MTRIRGRRSVRARAIALTVIGAVVVAGGLAVAGSHFSSSGQGPPRRPPVRVCGNAAILDGPRLPPQGAVAVQPGTDLNAVTQQQPRGTTFWLAPGRHTLGPGEFDQVIPKAGNVYVGAPGAVLDGQGFNRYAFTQRAPGVRIRHLSIRNFSPPANEGVVNQSAAEGWRIDHNTITANRGAAVFYGPGNRIAYNCLDANGQYGISGYRPPVPTGPSMSGIEIYRNEISGNNTDDLESKIPGCGCTGGAKFWDTQGAKVVENWVHDNKSVGLWADTNDIDFLIERNYIENNDGEGIFYEISYNASIRENTLVRNAIVKGRSFAAEANRFPIGAIYISESGGDDRVSFRITGRPRIEVSHNRLEDNWGGVVLFENANRFCNSPANTSSDYCTRVNPAVDLASCSPDTIERPPYYSDCRWKTQNVVVRDNDFRLDARKLPGCDPAYCGQMALFSQFGTYPSWSPYKGTRVQESITFRQNNRWRDNRYVGPWVFRPYDTAPVADFATWRGAPYRQDVSSTMRRGR